MKLIVDSGSTKASWALISDDGTLIKQSTTEGINPQFADNHTTIETILSIKQDLLSDYSAQQLWFYGAGCINQDSNSNLQQQLSSSLNIPEVYIHSDMLGAAHALFGINRGIACILGTGSNSALFDGNTLQYNTYAGGFILGDEGSGAVLGKRLIADWIKHRMPSHIYRILTDEYNLTYAEIVNKVYRQPYPNRYLATFAKAINTHINEEYMQNLVINEFSSFFTRNISQYPSHYPIGFIGSIAYHFAPYLNTVASQFGRTIVDIQQNPLKSLIKYHTSNTSQI